MEKRINTIRRKEIIRFMQTELEHQPDLEKQGVLNFLQKKKCSQNQYRSWGYDYIFSFEGVEKYNEKDVCIYRDKEDWPYILHEGKRLYFPKSMTAEKIRSYYNGIRLEQDSASPHRYETASFSVQSGDIAADIGAAEGNFGLSVVERVKALYLFECEEIWIEALYRTFSPWKDKVQIVRQYVSDYTDATHTTLDDFFAGQEINFIKADIEGSEVAMLQGAKTLLSQFQTIRMVLATYHRANDGEELKTLLEGNGFRTEYSGGYMIYPVNLYPPYLRRGLIRADKIRR